MPATAKNDALLFKTTVCCYNDVASRGALFMSALMVPVCIIGHPFRRPYCCKTTTKSTQSVL